jgi:hypothetical protein
MLASHNIAKSETGFKEMEVIHFDHDCASVWNFDIFRNSKYSFCTPLIMTLSFDDCLLFESMGYLSLFLSSFFLLFFSCFLDGLIHALWLGFFFVFSSFLS